MIEDRIYPCNINGKYYFKEVDLDKIAISQAEKIVEVLEETLNNSNSMFYNDENFRDYIQSVKNGDIDKILNPENSMYRTQFDLAVLEFGSYEFTRILFINSDDQTEEKYLKELDERIFVIQNAIYHFSESSQSNFNMPNNTDLLQKIYCNFIENFAPQRLLDYTTSPVNSEMLFGMKNLKESSMKSFYCTKVADVLLDFNNLYHLDDMVQVIYLYFNYLESADLEEKNGILTMIDGITTNGVCLNGNRRALINLANATSSQTINNIIDSIVLRLNSYKNSEKLDISDDFEQLLEKIYGIRQIYSLDSIYTGDRTLHKLLQLADLEILPDKEQKRLISFLDEFYERKNIETIDMSKFDEKIAKRDKFSKEDAKNFFESVMKLTVKEGRMPVQYNEFLMARIIENNPEFVENIDDISQAIIIEHFASIKSKQLTGNQNYITFSTNFADRTNGKITLGMHQKGYVKLRPIFCKNLSMSTVLNIITIFHELRHEQQQQDMSNNRYNHLTYMMAKERVFKANDREFYDKNYSTVYEELDAEYFALNMASNFLQTLPLDEEFKQSDEWKEILSTIKEKLEITKNGFTKAKNKEFKDGKMVDVEEAFDKIILEHPELVNLEPIFRVEYNENGSRKTVTQIFEELINTLRIKEDSLDNFDLYKYILFSGVRGDIDECIGLTDIKISNDLTPSVRNALAKLRYAVFYKGVGKAIPELEEGTDKIEEEHS